MASSKLYRPPGLLHAINHRMITKEHTLAARRAGCAGAVLTPCTRQHGQDRPCYAQLLPALVILCGADEHTARPTAAGRHGNAVWLASTQPPSVHTGWERGGITAGRPGGWADQFFPLFTRRHVVAIRFGVARDRPTGRERWRVERDGTEW